MEQFGLGAGLSAVAFWGFLATVIAAGVWHDIRRRDAQHETLRRLMESGKEVEQSLVDSVLGGGERLDLSLKIGGLVVVSLAPGLAILGWILSGLSDWALPALLGTGVLVACLGIGLLIASKSVERARRGGGTAERNTPGA